MIQCGRLEGISSYDTYEEGSVKDCMLGSSNLIRTPYGGLIPQYEDDGVRRKYTRSLSFFKNGSLKSVSLHKQTNILTPIGSISAELITFYEDGSIHRVFPLNGKITGYWSEKDEYELAPVCDLLLPFGSISMKIISIQFYREGKVKSLTFWPGDKMKIDTPIGGFDTRIGISFFADGKLKSFEPDKPVLVNTPIGELYAYDIDPLGIHGETNSLTFDEKGRIKSLVTSSTRIKVIHSNGMTEVYGPVLKPSLLEEDKFVIKPLRIEFNEQKVKIIGAQENVFDLNECSISIKSNQKKPIGRCSNCSNCNICT